MGHSAWPNAHYVINAVGKFNAQRGHRIDPVKDCASQQLQRPVSDKATTPLQRSPARRSRSKLGFRAWCALLERTSSKWTYGPAARQALSSTDHGGGKRRAGILTQIKVPTSRDFYFESVWQSPNVRRRMKYILLVLGVVAVNTVFNTPSKAQNY